MRDFVGGIVGAAAMVVGMRNAGAGIFLSCVSRELHGSTAARAETWEGSYRTALAQYLGRCGLMAVFQEQFTQGGGDTLEKLDTYIGRDCRAVIHLVGRGVGAVAKGDEVAALRRRHPDFLAGRPRLREALEGMGYAGISYTQWEALLALHHGVKLLMYTLQDEGVVRHPGFAEQAGEMEMQQAHLDRLRASGIHAERMGDVKSLLVEVGAALQRERLMGEGQGEAVGLKQNMPYKPLGVLFKGREGFLQRIAASVVKSGTASTAIQAIHGTGGIGKTRSAVEYAWARQEQYEAMLFMNGDAAERVDVQLANLAGVLDVTSAEVKDDVRLAEVLKWLNTHPRWLLIVDNVDSVSAREAVLARLGALTAGHVMITTRLKDWPADVEALSLDLLTEQDAVALLLEERGSNRRHAADDAEKAKAVAAVVGRLSLGLMQARSFVSVKKTTYGDYLKRFHANDGKAIEWFDASLCQYPRETAIAWQTSVEQLSAGARGLLETLAWFGPEAIPEGVLEVMPAEVAERLPEGRELLIELNGMSLAELDDVEPPTFWVHRLIQSVTRRKLLAKEGSGAPGSLVDAVAWMTAAFSGDPGEPATWPRLRGLAPHAIAVATAGDERGLNTAWLFNQTGYLAWATGDYAAAEGLYRRALAAKERLLGAEDPDTLLSVNNLAFLLQAKGDLPTAEPLYRRALAGREKVLGREDVDTLESVNNLAGLLYTKGDLEGAEPLYRRALAGYERVLGKSAPDTLMAVNNLAALLQAREDLAGAEPLYRRALVGYEREYGAGHPVTLHAVRNLGVLLREKGELAEAEPLLRRALAGLEGMVGREHPDTLRTVSSLAGLVREKGDAEMAEGLYRRALEGYERLLGAEHAETLAIVGRLGVVMESRKELEAAEGLYRRAVVGFLRASRQNGFRHPGLRMVEVHFRRLLERMGTSDREIEESMGEMERDAGFEGEA